MNEEQYLKKIARGIELMRECVDTQNTIIEAEGKITIDDKRIWDPYLHTWSNDDWLLMLAALEYLQEEDQQHFQQIHIDAIHEAKDIVIDYYGIIDRVMDVRNKKMNHKRISWKMIMSMREIFNGIDKKDINNKLRTRPVRENTYNNLFD